MIKRKQLGLGTHAWGEASVLATELKLIYQGYDVYRPAVDHVGVDLAIIRGKKVVRLQVKCSSLVTKAKEETVTTGYEFSLTSIRLRGEGSLSIKTRKFTEEVDFVILHGVDEDKFWVVPADLLDDRKSVTIYSNSRSKLDIDWAVIKQRRDDGETLRAIGDSVGISASAVLERLRGTTKEAGTKIVNQLRACEDAWQLIEQCLIADQ